MSASDAAIETGNGTSAAFRDVLVAVVFGLRLWASVCLAFYVSFTLELDMPSWAATTAALVCQPALGASLRKASFRMIGTVVGAAGTVVLAALFRQDRVLFLGGLALGCAASVFVATLLRNFAAYGAALAGFTAAVLASDILGPTGAAHNSVVILAVDRSVEICVGIVSAGVVLALTDLGHARRRLATEMADLSVSISEGFAACMRGGGPDAAQSRSLRRKLLARVIALDPMIDTAIGEASDLRRRSPILQQAVVGLIGMISSWRKAALQIEARQLEDVDREAAVFASQPFDQLSTSAKVWMAKPAELRRQCCAGLGSLSRSRTQEPSQQLHADTAAEGLLGAARALNGLTQILDPRRALDVRKAPAFTVPDWLPSFVNAARAFAIVVILSAFWIESAWASGPLAITFGAAVAVLFPLQGDQAYSASMTFLQGCVMAAGGAAILVFWVLPTATTFPDLCFALALVLVPAGAFIALPWRPTLFFAASINLLPMLSISNRMTFDAQAFWNSTIAILAGIAVATIMMRVAPPLSPEFRTRRLLALMLADLRRLAKSPEPGGREAWEARARGRLLAIPAQAAPLERAEASSALAVGVEVVRLRRVAPRFVPASAVDGALDAIAKGNCAAAIERLADLDRQLAPVPRDGAGGRVALRLRASILAVQAELREFATFFEARPV